MRYRPQEKGRNILGCRSTHFVRARRVRAGKVGAYVRCTIREERYRDGRIERNGKEKCAQRARGREKRNLPPAVSKPAVCVGGPCTSNWKVPENETASGGDADGVSVNGIGSGGDLRAKTSLQKEKEKRRRGTREESSAPREGVTRTMGRILYTSQQKITAIRKSRKNYRRKAQRHPNDEQLQDDEEQRRAPHNHAGGAWRYQSHAHIVRRKIEAIVMKREVKCELSRPSVERRKTTGEGAGRIAHTDEGGETKTPTAKVPLLRPLAAGSEFQRDRRHLRAPHEEVQYAVHASPNSKGKAQSPDGTPAHPRTAALGLRARLRAQRRNTRAVVLCLMRVAVAGGSDGGRGGVGGVEGRSSRKEHGPRQVGICEERVLASCMLSVMEGKYGESVQRNRGGEARKDGRQGPGLRIGWWRGKDGAGANEKTGSSVNKKEE
ncbi:hypothetical protein B0H17DRAFT_1148377 [Mycena rosella]|uniref:Uncharacterized protein n=1 Tax=Mycena rosella TaxID=1033263 RepID=A0AAD7FZB1_MYCRO|nr:hypothetical protein B0H17DRAFT_1148377 [Mycena rosella]